MDTTKAEFKASYGLSSQLPERDRQLLKMAYEEGLLECGKVLSDQ